MPGHPECGTSAHLLLAASPWISSTPSRADDALLNVCERLMAMWGTF